MPSSTQVHLGMNLLAVLLSFRVLMHLLRVLHGSLLVNDA